MGVRPAVARAIETIRPTRAVVDLGALGDNLARLRQVGGEVEIYGVIKADAYGHGAVEVARCLAARGVDGLCVALPEEGIELRAAGVSLPILVLGGTYGYGASDTIAYGLIPVVHDLEQVASLHEASRGRPVKVHLKVDTGMSRLGVPDHALPRFLWRARRYSSVVFDGFMSHLACAEYEPAGTMDQLRRFRAALDAARSAGLRPTAVHLANSAAFLRFPETHLDLVRPGLALYGVNPTGETAEPPLVPVMRVQTEVVQLRRLRPGDRVSYGGTFTASRPSSVAVLPVGYADGVSQRMAGAGSVLVRGRRARVVGAVCMDMCMVDVTDIEGVAVRDEVVLLGRQRDEEITAQELATVVESVPHDVLTSFSRRVPRFYRR